MFFRILETNKINICSLISNVKIKSQTICRHIPNQCNHSHKKRKDSLKGSLHRVLFGAEAEFPKLLVPRLPQSTSNVNIECARKSRQLYFYVTLSTGISSFYYSDVNLF